MNNISNYNVFSYVIVIVVIAYFVLRSSKGKSEKFNTVSDALKETVCTGALFVITIASVVSALQGTFSWSMEEASKYGGIALCVGLAWLFRPTPDNGNNNIIDYLSCAIPFLVILGVIYTGITQI